MKLIIDIPDEQYEYIKKSDKNTFAAVSSKECMLYAIKNGTPISTEGDLISRSELKKAIENYLAKRKDVIIWETDMLNMLDNAPTVDCIEFNRAKELIKQAYQKGKDIRPQGEWILVGERLPEKYKEVIVTDIETEETYCSWYHGNGYWECDNGVLKNRIIAWQPLPKPYKKGGAE